MSKTGKKYKEPRKRTVKEITRGSTKGSVKETPHYTKVNIGSLGGPINRE